MSRRFRLCLLIATAAVIGAAWPATAQQLPALLDLPPNVAATRPSLATEREYLRRERNDLHNGVNNLNADCAAVDARNTAKIASCTNRKQDLNAALNRHIERSRTYNVLAALNTLAERSGWSSEKQQRLNEALSNLRGYRFDCTGKSFSFDRDCSIYADHVWSDAKARATDQALAQEAARGDGPGAAWAAAGQQSHEDCAVFALANATGRPYGWVAAQAAELIRNNESRSAEDRNDPAKTIATGGLTGGEVIMLAEAFGTARVVESGNYAEALRQGSYILIGTRLGDGEHQVVLSKTFQHNGETWFEMMDSNQGAMERLYLSAAELDGIRLENGVAYHPEAGRTPVLLR